MLKNAAENTFYNLNAIFSVHRNCRHHEALPEQSRRGCRRLARPLHAPRHVQDHGVDLDHHLCWMVSQTVSIVLSHPFFTSLTDTG